MEKFKGISIVLTKEQHRKFTKLWRNAIKYGSGTAEATYDAVIKNAREIYSEDILNALGLW